MWRFLILAGWIPTRDFYGNGRSVNKPDMGAVEGDPASVTSVLCSTLSPTVIRVTWTASTSGDADSVWVRYDSTGYPADVTQGADGGKRANSAGIDTIGGLTQGTKYYVSVLVGNDADMWADTSEPPRSPNW